MSTKYPWTEENAKELEQTRRYGKHDAVCASQVNPENAPIMFAEYPEIDQEFVPEDVCKGFTPDPDDPGNGKGFGLKCTFTPTALLVLSALLLAIRG
jgi:hypothetical protein